MANFLDRDRLFSGLDQLNLKLTDDQIYKIDHYSALLFKWNKTFNLTAITDKNEVLTHHILDSLATIPVFEKYLNRGASLLDVGSGGGLPGIPLAIMFPECKINLVDTVGKKTAFLTQVALTLKLSNVNVIHNRVEKIKESQFDLISSRAFSSLRLFIDLTKDLLKSDGYWIALKGQYPHSELSELKNAFSYQVQTISVPFLSEDRNIVIISNNHHTAS